MADETPENDVIEAPENTESSVEDLAKEQGWKPKEEFEGNEVEWVDAAEFLRRGPLLKEISTAHKQIKTLKQTMNQLMEHHKKTLETAKQQALAELKAQKKVALENDDADAVIEIDERMAEIREQARAEQPTKKDNEALFMDWAKKNDWWESDPQMTRFAKIVANGLVKADPDIDPEDLLEEVTSEVKSRFPDKFQSTKKRAAAVDGGGDGRARSGTKKSGPISFEDLTAEEKQLCVQFERAGVLKREDYLKDIATQRGLK